LAIRRLTIQRVVVEHAKFRSLVIDDLTVGRLRAGEVTINEALTVPEPWTIRGGER